MWVGVYATGLMGEVGTGVQVGGEGQVMQGGRETQRDRAGLQTVKT